MLKWAILITLVLSLTMTAAAQEATSARVPHVIDSVEMIEYDEGTLTLQIMGHQTDSCETLVIVEQERIGYAVFIDIYREIPPFVTCEVKDVAYETEITLEEAFDGHNLLVVINDSAALIHYLSNNLGNVSDYLSDEQAEPNPPLLNESQPRLDLLKYEPVQIESMGLYTAGDGIYLRAAGIYQSGCGGGSTFVRQQKHAAGYFVDIVEVRLGGDICPFMARLYDANILIVISEELPVSVNGQLVEAQMANLPVRSLTLIDSVEVLILESFPVQLNLVVKGSHPDGCELPVIVSERREGNLIQVEIFREVPIAAICPMILLTYEETISLKGSYEPGKYQIDVNGFVVEVEF